MKKQDQHELNRFIEELVRSRDANGAPYTPDDISILQRYTGSGGLASKGATGRGLLHEFYTPPFLADIMWRLAFLHGFDGGNVLEPAAGTGRLVAGAPDKSKVVAYELNPVSRRIAEICNPGATILGQHFETAFMEPPRFTRRLPGARPHLAGWPFSLVIGNPPFGARKNLYSSFFNNPPMPSLEAFFIHQGLYMLKPGGLLIYLIPSGFLRNGQAYDKAKLEIGRLAAFVDAFRLPPAIERTDTPLDILILRRR